jgi:hypothetical protein
MAENDEPLELWMAVQTQWRAGAMGVIGLDYRVLYLEAARLEIELSNCLMNKIRALERSTLESMVKLQERSGPK